MHENNNGNQIVKFYVDGNLRGNNSYSAFAEFINSDPLTGGSVNIIGGNQRNFHGDIDDIRIYNRLLSEEEINLLYNSYQPKMMIKADAPKMTSNLQKGLILDVPLKQKYMKSSSLTFDRTPYSNDCTFTNSTINNSSASVSMTGSISCGNKIYLDIKEELTVGAWVKFNYLDYENSTGRLLSIGLKGQPDSPSPHSGWWFRYDNRNNSKSFAYTCFGNTNGGYAGGGNNFGGSNYQYVFLQDEWYHLAFVINSNNGILFINGNQHGPVKTFNNLSLSDTSRVLTIGNNLDGDISDFRIYNRALTHEEISLLYSRGRH